MPDASAAKTGVKFLRLALRGVIALAAIIVLVILGALGYRAWRQHENALALAIDPKTGIEETMYVPLGGIDQWIQIRGEDRKNPLLLFLHGGPGSTVSPVSSLLRPWEKYFTVVMWDQRDAGKTFVRNGPVADMSLPRVAQDGVELAQFLCRHLGKRKVIVVGVSWGTMVGVRMVHDRPDLFSAYVGTGQVVSIAEKEPVDYAQTMQRLVVAHDDEGIRDLKASGAPPYRSFHELMVERNLSDRTESPSERGLLDRMLPIALVAPGWSLWDLYESLQSSNYAEAATFDADASYDARKLGTDFSIPFFVFNGTEDHTTPVDFARRYVDSIHAPVKEFVALNGLGHDAVITDPDLFLRELVTRVRPAALQAENEPK
jgi:pimeloyl-ACP methyl ester carboxylesterase